MKKILVVGDFISGSGLTQVIFNVFSRFPEDQCQISAVGYGIDQENEVDKTCEKLGWPIYRVIPVTKNPIKHWQWWKHFFKNNHFDVVYFNYSSSWNYLPVIYAKRYGKVKDVICHSHNSYFSHEFSNSLLMKILITVNNHGKKVFNTYADTKIATSKEAANWMFNEDKDVIISINGINLPKFVFSTENRKQLRKQINVNDNTRVIGFVGVLQKRKNPLFALSVFARFHKANPDSKFLMFGHGPLKQQIDESIQKLGIQDSVIQYDFANDINKWYSAMDALLFPSMYEGLSLVAIESQVSNLKILASDTNVDDIFATDNIIRLNGMNSNNWANQLQNVLKEHKNRDYLDEHLKKFSIDHQAKQIEKIILD